MQLKAEDFYAMVRRIGLDPMQHDLEELRSAYMRLGILMSRLRSSERLHNAETLSVFNPKQRLNDD